MAIIQTPQSMDDMGLLFGHANNIGINQILLFPFQADGEYSGVQNAVYEGWRSNWVLEFQKEILKWWCCSGYYWDDQCGFKSQNYTGNTQWVLGSM